MLLLKNPLAQYSLVLKLRVKFLQAYLRYDLEQLYIGLIVTNTKFHGYRQPVVEIQIRIFLSA